MIYRFTLAQVECTSFIFYLTIVNKILPQVTLGWHDITLQVSERGHIALLHSPEVLKAPGDKNCTRPLVITSEI